MYSDLIKIKEKYGEKMMHFCRKYFSTILETDGLLFELLSSHFQYSKFLYDDIISNDISEQFKNFIYSLVYSNEEELLDTSKTALELFNDLGYDLYQCFSEEDIQSYRKYYASGEELCSFRGGRLNECYVFFAVKKDVDKIKREDFINPMRQDRYGTSVISIQFTKGNVNTLSIKNRYNHSVVNPDATYSNNLDNIIPGLTKSFCRDYNLNINQNINGCFEIPGYVIAKDGKYYKYNYEINNIYYCVDNIIIDNFNVINEYYEKEKYLLLDYFMVDLVNKKIFLYDKNINDSFVDGLNNIKKIIINRDKNTGNKILDIIFIDGSNACIEIDKYNKIISYKNNNIFEIEDDFLHENISLENIDIPNVVKIGNNFLTLNKGIKRILFNNLLTIGDNFLSQNNIINKLELDNVLCVGKKFLFDNLGLYEVNMPKLEKVGCSCLEKNRNINKIDFSNLFYVEDNFLRYNISLKSLTMPNLVYIGSNFVAANKIIDEIYLPKIKDIGDNFLYCNRELKKIEFLKLQYISNNFMFCNRKLDEALLPELIVVGMKFLYNNNSIEEMRLFKLFKAGKYFMFYNNSLKLLLVPRLKLIDGSFLYNNKDLICFEIENENLNTYDNVKSECMIKKLIK